MVYGTSKTQLTQKVCDGFISESWNWVFIRNINNLTQSLTLGQQETRDGVKVGLSVLLWVVIQPFLWRSLSGHPGRPCGYSCKATWMANTGALCILVLCRLSPLEPQSSKINKTLKSLSDFFFFSLQSQMQRTKSNTHLLMHIASRLPFIFGVFCVKK